MQVVHPYPTRLKPSSSSGSVRPARSRYSVTTFDPGASDVFTHGLERSPRATALRASTPAPTITDGFEVLVQLVMAAITTSPWSSSKVSPSSVTGRALWLRSSVSATVAPGALAAVRRERLGGRLGVVPRGAVGGRVRGGVALFLGLVVGVAGGRGCAVATDDLGQGLAEGPARAAQRDAILRAAGAGERGFHFIQVELDVVGEGGLLGVLVVPQALLAGVGLDQRDLRLGAPGQAHVGDRLGVDREDRAGGAELRRHVADRGAVGDRERGEPGAVELDEHPHHAALAQPLGDRQHEVGGGRAGGQLAVEPEAEYLGDQHRHRLSEHRRLGLDARPPPSRARRGR